MHHEHTSLAYSNLGNQKESCRWRRIAAENGNTEAQLSIGEYYELGLTGCGISKDYAQAAVWYLKAAEQGDWLAQDSLASLYNNGQGVAQDYSKAAIWWRKAAEQGDANSQFYLGLAYFDGKGVPNDSKQAVQWFEKAAEPRKGNTAPEEWVRNTANRNTAKAEYMLGLAYSYGEGVPQNYVEAASWYRRAADKGDAGAQSDLGELYLNGGVLKEKDGSEGKNQPLVRDNGGGIFQKDYGLAAFWLRKAAEQGDSGAQNDLGLLYEDGNGVPQDYAEAYFWYSVAVAKTPTYSGNRDRAASKLTKTILLQTQARAGKWAEEHPTRTEQP